jgi:hypothetical protein
MTFPKDDCTYDPIDREKWTAYEAAKRNFLEQHPGATQEEYEDFVRELVKDLGL